MKTTANAMRPQPEFMTLALMRHKPGGIVLCATRAGLGVGRIADLDPCHVIRAVDQDHVAGGREL